MKKQNSSRSTAPGAGPNRFRKGVILGAAVALAVLAVMLHLRSSNVAPQPAALTRAVRGTAIDSSPQTSPAAAPLELLANELLTNAIATNAAAPKPVTLAAKVDYLETGFDKLSSFSAEVVYEEVETNSRTFVLASRMTGQIPDWIKALDKQNVAVRGFMLPLKEENGLTTDFILLKGRMMCCFGVPPGINEWIHVRTTNAGLRSIMDTPVTIYGKLHVGEYRENRTMLGIYQLDGERMDGPRDL